MFCILKNIFCGLCLVSLRSDLGSKHVLFHFFERYGCSLQKVFCSDLHFWVVLLGVSRFLGVLGLVECGILAGLISVVSITAVFGLGDEVKRHFEYVASEMPGASGEATQGEGVEQETPGPDVFDSSDLSETCFSVSDSGNSSYRNYGTSQNIATETRCASRILTAQEVRDLAV